MSDNENATQFEDSDSESDYNLFAYFHAPSFVYHDAPPDTDSDNEDTNSPPIQLINTADLWAKLESRVYSPVHG
ncbi:hypothetical protein K503DRAFT_824733 [Rhizopogon vinicolor AM-OR11-026]|uniref:Uncharacterized protein n=1 Tax=Rhizopogon vinicolor AM-OR11-026 TaxID=1314800 RepID=A0A1B7MVJ1_9AGAM|nr:hypothetical protein K503DRAFT_824733 [Rhizopogon vinicolor AM-OR11-026]